ncbi:tripartite tricarboxylate transporter substrate binding protein [Cupriavidus necator]|uniref:Bug family tripartite tricarboxylate transporter substrate binding protein n=1 Tax=Cupriavidus necator TaxID=106590 RepID=UPI0039C0DFC0
MSVTLLATFMALGVARAQPNADSAYPSRPITIVVPHAPGGSVDGLARVFAMKLGEELKQSVIVENRPGASGLVGAGIVARSTPDGYTLYINASIHNINPMLYRKTIKFDAVKDFTAVSMLAQGALIFSVNPQVPAKSALDLAKAVKANHRQYNFATSGNGSAGHLALSKYMYDSGIADLQVPIALYKGGGPALADLMGGQAQAMMDPMLSSLPSVKAGKLRAIAVTGRTRSPLLPDVPTMQEAGFKDFEFYSWYGLWAPAKLPDGIRKKLDTASAKIMAAPDIRERLTGLGFESAYKNGGDFEKYIDSETKRYRAIIDRAHITAD